MKAIIYYRDGKKHQKTINVPGPEIDIDSIVRDFVYETGMPHDTYIDSVVVYAPQGIIHSFRWMYSAKTAFERR